MIIIINIEECQYISEIITQKVKAILFLNRQNNYVKAIVKQTKQRRFVCFFFGGVAYTINNLQEINMHASSSS